MGQDVKRAVWQAYFERGLPKKESQHPQCSVMPVGSGNLRVGPVPVMVEAKGRDWTGESNTLLVPGWGSCKD